MTNDPIDTCAQPVQQGIRNLLTNLPNASDNSLELSPAFYIISKFDDEIARNYINNVSWDERHFTDIWVSDFEYLHILNSKYSDDYSCEEVLESIDEKILAHQAVNGSFGLDKDRETASLFSYLATRGISRNRLERTIEYVLSDSYLSDASLNSISDIIFGLSELDYHNFEEEIQELGGVLMERLEDSEIVDVDIPVNYHAMRALSRVPGGGMEFAGEISNHALSKIEQDKEFDITFADIDDWTEASIISIQSRSMLLLGHMYAGKGIKLPQSQVEWERRIEENKRQYELPNFVSTLPSTRLSSRKNEIKKTAERIIKSCDGTLRISTIRMDMLHDEIINRLQSDEELEVRLLTSKGTSSGNRAKMKKAVMNEMVKRLDGGVKEDSLVHARMVIGDDDLALISSADLTRDQLNDEFNAGVFTRNPDFVEQSIEFFDAIWEDAEYRGVKD